ncbi:Blp family class II bacteriocin [Streptococcus cuniculipharyngis]|uniref:Blp family class II bacteriocin n=1 Tax=Streptococcus cuniculipharyngis TaxID=1562651 RepID=UPI003CCC8CCA
MNTKTISQFELLDIEHFAIVEGGYSSNNCIRDMGASMLAGAGQGHGGQQLEELEQFQVHLLERMLEL